MRRTLRLATRVGAALALAALPACARYRSPSNPSEPPAATPVEAPPAEPAPTAPSYVDTGSRYLRPEPLGGLTVETPPLGPAVRPTPAPTLSPPPPPTSGTEPAGAPPDPEGLPPRIRRVTVPREIEGGGSR